MMEARDAQAAYDLEVFYDSGCPLCRREIALLERWNRRGRLRFTDIDAPGFPESGCEKTHPELMAQLHGRLPDGSWVTGMEVIRRMYAAVGLGWLVPVTRWPIIRSLLDLSYAWFARNRLWLTGRRDTTACETGCCETRNRADAVSR
jgi:predicted DCC family thiol-disulfide oxidoreductase YuxK